MQRKNIRTLSLLFCTLFFSHVEAKFNDTTLNLGSTSTGVKDAVAEAIGYSSSSSFSRVKLAGSWQPSFGVGYQVTSIDDRQLFAVTDSLYAPRTFQGLNVRAGIGLPFGFAAESGIIQMTSDHGFTAIHGSLSFQPLDLVNTLYTDLVPSLVISQQLNWVLTGASFWGTTTRITAGSYHRDWFAQFGYVGEFNLFSYTGTSEAHTTKTHRHGVMSLFPVWEGLGVETAVYILPNVSGSLGMTYQF